MIKEKIKEWFKDPYNTAFFILLITVFAIRLYYFSLISSQPLWWDEADYMNIAKTWLGADYWNLADDVTRPILFPVIAALFMILGLGEISIRFFVMLTSLASIALVYGIGKLLFNKRIALISAFLLAIFWSFTFYSFRLLVDVSVTMLWLATIYFFFSAYYKEKNWKHFILPAIFLGLSFLMKFSSTVLVVIFVIYLLTTEKLKVFKNKKIWIFFLTALITILPLFIYQYSVYGHPLQFQKTVTETGNPYANNIADNLKSLTRQLPFIFSVISPNVLLPILPAFFSRIISFTPLILFILGMLLTLFYIFSSPKEITAKKTKNNSLYFLLLWLIFNFIFFARLISSDTSYLDERYYHVFYPAIFLFFAIGLNYLYKLIKKYNKQIAFILIIATLIFITYQNLVQADNIIKLRKDSYMQLKLAGEYIKQNTAPEDVVMLVEEQAEISYYSQRKWVNVGYNSSKEIISIMEKNKPKYVVISLYYSLGNDQRPIEYVFSNPDLFIPVQAYGPYIDEEQTVPLVTIFKVNPMFYALP